MIKLSQTALFIINKVRLFRLELGLSQRYISKAISENTDSNLLGDIESEKRSNQYTDDQLNIIAIEFSKVAQNHNGKLQNKVFSIYNLYPDQILGDQRVDKKIISIPIGLSPMGMINMLIEEGVFFDKQVTVKEVTDHCNHLTTNTWKTKDFTAQLENAVKYNMLERIDLPNGSVKYQKKK
jgi:hypothetical protein